MPHQVGLRRNEIDVEWRTGYLVISVCHSKVVYVSLFRWKLDLILGSSASFSTNTDLSNQVASRFSQDGTMASVWAVKVQRYLFSSSSLLGNVQLTNFDPVSHGWSEIHPEWRIGYFFVIPFDGDKIEVCVVGSEGGIVLCSAIIKDVELDLSVLFTATGCLQFSVASFRGINLVVNRLRNFNSVWLSHMDVGCIRRVCVNSERRSIEILTAILDS